MSETESEGDPEHHQHQRHHRHHKRHHAREEREIHGGGGPLYEEGDSPRLPGYPLVRFFNSPSAYYPKGWVFSKPTPVGPPLLPLGCFLFLLAIACIVLIKLFTG